MAEGCVFCKIARKEIDASIVDETQNFIAFLDANPRTEGHTLVVPKKHFTTLLDLPEDLASEMLQLIKKVAEKRIKEGAEGFNIVVNNGEAAGQVIKHLHVHILPRKKEDKVSIGGL